MVAVASIDSIPLKINNSLPGGISLSHYPFRSGKIRFRKIADGMSELIDDYKNRDHRYSYNLRELLSTELSREYLPFLYYQSDQAHEGQQEPKGRFSFLPQR